MKPSLSSTDEASRARLVRALVETSTAEPGNLHALVRLAATALRVPVAAMSFLDDATERFVASIGLQLTAIPSAAGFCADTLTAGDVHVVRDVRADDRRTASPLLDIPLGIRFYAGAPIEVDGQRVGAVSCMDRHVRDASIEDQQALRDVAALAGDLLHCRLHAHRLNGNTIVVGASADTAMLAIDERWRLAVESGGQGVWDWDSSKKGVYFSDAWKAILGYAGHEIGSHLREWLSRIHPDDLAPAKAKLVAHLRGEVPLYAAEHRMRHKDGHDIWVLNSGKVVRRAKSGRALRMVGTLIDVTRQRHEESTLRNQRAAEIAHVAKSEFLSRMSHEMRTPLNAVIGFTQLLLSRADSPDAPEVRDYAEHVLRAGEQLLCMTNDVLDLQHVEEGRIALDFDDVPLGRVVAEVITQLRPAADLRGVGFFDHIEDGVTVRADERRLCQVMLNIASNAVKYNRPAGIVRWSATGGLGEGRVRISIEDTGSGLKPNQLDRLFQPFERLGRETSSIEGTGLGLIIARSLTAAMGGTLELASSAGIGTRVVIDLPAGRQTALPFTQPAELDSIQPNADCAEAASQHGTQHAGQPKPHEAEPSQHAASVPVPGEAASPRSLRLLYVEDNLINAILFEEAIRLRDDVELRLAEDGSEALDQVRDWKPDVLVLDAHLPGMDGFALLDALRAQPGLTRVPAFMCSADAMPADVERAAQAGFAGYWPKPINLARIMSDLDRISAGLPPVPASERA